tara:strand:+ start:2834 stop:3559 length:726 start_codon:yes stop_codon:yes gene_type:complete
MKNWEIKDRVYALKGNQTPLSYTIKSRGLYFFDKEKGYERIVQYSPNQKTAFVDEMQGNIRMEHITFRDGFLSVPKNKVMLQQFLSLYHPHRDKLYEEINDEAEAKNHADWLELELEAMTACKSLSLDKVSAIMRVNKGIAVDKMSSDELRRDALLYAKNNPIEFLKLCEDEDVSLKDMALKAESLGVIKLSEDKRHFKWGSNGRKLMTVPFEEEPYSALSAWFKTDEGLEVLKTIEKKIK